MQPLSLSDILMDELGWSNIRQNHPNDPDWGALYDQLHNRADNAICSPQEIDLATFIQQRCGTTHFLKDTIRSEPRQARFRHALTIVFKYRDRFGNLPSVELLKTVI